MPNFQYATQGGLKTFEAADSASALQALPSDALPNSGVMLMETPKTIAPVTTVKPEITSSSSPVLQKQTGEAMSGATTALNNNGSNDGLSSFDREYFKRMDARESSALSGEKDSLKIAAAQYDTSLARLNSQSSELAQEIETRYNNTRQIAATNAAALNPYNQSRGAQTANNFQAKITDNFNSALTKLQQNTEMEKRALEVGNMSAVNAIKADTRKTLADLDDNIFNYGLEMKKEAEANKRFELNYGLQKEQLDVTKQGRAQDDFQTYINTMSGSPGLQTDISNYFSTGTISPGLAPFIERGMAAGMSPTESLSVLQYQSDKVRQTEENARLSEMRIINAQNEAGDRQTKAMNLASTMASLQTRSQELIAVGVKPGSLEYAIGMSGATAGSQTGMSAAEASGYTTIANIGSQLVGLKDSLDAVKDDNDLKNIVLNKTGASAQSLTSPELAILTSKINAIAAPVARVMFGERGVLTEPDIKRVMSTLPSGASTAEVRDALYKQILVNAKVGAINKLSIDASTGRNTTGVAPYIEQFVNEIDGVLNTMGGTTAPGGSSVDDFLKSKGIKTSFNMVGNTTASINIPTTSRLAYVNNNPGNLKFAEQTGAIKGEKGFAKFKSAKEGFDALVRQVKLDASRNLSLQSFVNKFAPPSENNTKLYISQLATALGITPETLIKNVDSEKIARAVAKKESSTIIS